MSVRPTNDPATTSSPAAVVEIVIDARERDIGSFKVRRLLPFALRRLVGPFIYFDHMGPLELPSGEGVDVRPHPHIGLATVTYLFEGELVHRDSLGSHQPIRPGEINWMTAGRGVTHSERTSAELRASGSPLHGLQLWVALPTSHEDVEPEFRHYGADALPSFERDGARVRVLAGEAYGLSSPVHTYSPLFYIEVELASGAELSLPTEHVERALYVVDGAVTCGGEHAEEGRMLVFAPNASAQIHAKARTRLVLIGGAPLDGMRRIDWNFVSSSQERIDRAKAEYQAGRFPRIPGDDDAFVSMPAKFA